MAPLGKRCENPACDSFISAEAFPAVVCRKGSRTPSTMAVFPCLKCGMLYLDDGERAYTPEGRSVFLKGENELVARRV